MLIPLNSMEQSYLQVSFSMKSLKRCRAVTLLTFKKTKTLRTSIFIPLLRANGFMN